METAVCERQGGVDRLNFLHVQLVLVEGGAVWSSFLGKRKRKTRSPNGFQSGRTFLIRFAILSTAHALRNPHRNHFPCATASLHTALCAGQSAF